MHARICGGAEEGSACLCVQKFTTSGANIHALVVVVVTGIFIFVCMHLFAYTEIYKNQKQQQQLKCKFNKIKIFS